jgi:hypothetical protein
MFITRTLQKATMIGAATLMIGAGGALAESHSTMPDTDFLTSWQ